MTEPLTQVHVESEIWRLSKAAEDQSHELAEHSRSAAEADVAYKVCHAKALLQAEGTVGERDARAVLACESQYRAKRATEAVQLACQERGRNLRAQLDALRSINANVRALVVDR